MRYFSTTVSLAYLLFNIVVKSAHGFQFEYATRNTSACSFAAGVPSFFSAPNPTYFTLEEISIISGCKGFVVCCEVKKRRRLFLSGKNSYYGETRNQMGLPPYIYIILEYFQYDDMEKIYYTKFCLKILHT